MLTTKDLLILNDALAQYQALLEDGPGSGVWDYHKETYGDPIKTVEATRNRVHNFIIKRTGTCV